MNDWWDGFVVGFQTGVGFMLLVSLVILALST